VNRAGMSGDEQQCSYRQLAGSSEASPDQISLSGSGKAHKRPVTARASALSRSTDRRRRDRGASVTAGPDSCGTAGSAQTLSLWTPEMAQRSACWSGVADRCGGVYGSCTAGSLIVGERPAVADDAPTGGQGGVR